MYSRRRVGRLEGYDPGSGTRRGARLVEIGVHGDRVGNDDAWEMEKSFEVCYCLSYRLVHAFQERKPLNNSAELPSSAYVVHPLTTRSCLSMPRKLGNLGTSSVQGESGTGRFSLSGEVDAISKGKR